MEDQTRNQPAAAGEGWPSVEEIMAHLGVARDTVYRWIDQKGLLAHRLCKRRKFKVSEVDNSVRSGGADQGSSGKSKSGHVRRRRV